MNLLLGREENIMENISCRDGFGEMRDGKKKKGGYRERWETKRKMDKKKGASEEIRGIKKRKGGASVGFG